MAERGPYDEGMKDEGWIISMEELMQVDDDGSACGGDWEALQDEP